MAGIVAPWLGLSFGLLVQVLAGNTYNFPLYSSTLKSVLGYNQQQLTNLGVANDIGENVGLLAGLLCNKIPPWAILLIGSVAAFLGYGVLWIVVGQIINPLPYWVVWLALCLGANSSTWFNTAVLVTNMRNFPLSRGTVAGILKGYVGLSAAVYTEVYNGILDKDSVKLLLFLTVGLPAVCLVVMYFIRPCPPASEEDSGEHRHFVFIQATSIILGFYLLVTVIIDDVYSLDTSFVSKLFTAFMLLLLLAPLGIPLRLAFHMDSDHTNVNKSLDSDADHTKEPLLCKDGNSSGSKSDAKLPENPSGDLPSSNMPDDTRILNQNRYLGSTPSLWDEEDMDLGILLAEGEGAVRKKRRPRRGEDFKLRQALVKADFWLLFAVYFCGVGSGVTVLNNLSQIGLAEGLEDVTILLSLFSICNFLGRLAGGAVSEHYVRLKAMPRTVWMTVTQTLMIGAHLFFASALPGSLYVGSSLLGVCYGVQFSVMVPTASELFGLKHFGMIYNFLTIGNPLGAFFFSGLLAGYIYDREAEKQGGYFHPGNMTHMRWTTSECIGANCFRLTFQIMAVVCGLGVLLSIILTFRIRPVYEMLYAGGSFRIPGTAGSQR